MQKLGVSRRELWERLDRPALKPLPAARYELAQWKKLQGEHRLPRRDRPPPLQRAVPARRPAARGALQRARSSRSTTRASAWSPTRGATTAVPRRAAEHMPSSHRAHAEWTPSRLIHWAEKTGPACGRVVAGILKSRPHPEQGYRACLGLMRLGKRYGAERLEAACERAEHLRSYSYRTVKNILASSQDRLPLEEEPSHASPRSPTTTSAAPSTTPPRPRRTNADRADAGEDERDEAVGHGRRPAAAARLGRARQAGLRRAARAARRRRVDRARAAQAHASACARRSCATRPRSRTSTSSTRAVSTASRCSASATAASSRAATTW